MVIKREKEKKKEKVSYRVIDYLIIFWGKDKVGFPGTICPGLQSPALNSCLVHNAVSYPLWTLDSGARPGAVWAHSRPNHSVVFTETQETR